MAHPPTSRDWDMHVIREKIANAGGPFSLPIEMLETIITTFREMNLQIPVDIKVAYEQKMRAQYNYIPLQLPSGPPQITRPTYKKTEIKPLSPEILVQFVGGPRNTEQQYYPRKEIPPKDGDILICKISIGRPLSLDKDGNIVSFKSIETDVFSYKLTHIPSDQTPFSDSEVVIGLYQEKTS